MREVGESENKVTTGTWPNEWEYSEKEGDCTRGGSRGRQLQCATPSQTKPTEHRQKTITLSSPERSAQPVIAPFRGSLRPNHPSHVGEWRRRSLRMLDHCRTAILFVSFRWPRMIKPPVDWQHYTAVGREMILAIAVRKDPFRSGLTPRPNPGRDSAA